MRSSNGTYMTAGLQALVLVASLGSADSAIAAPKAKSAGSKVTKVALVAAATPPATSASGSTTAVPVAAPAASTSIVDSSAVAPSSARDRMVLSYFAYLNGPSIAGTATDTVDYDGQADGKVNLDGYVTGGYRFVNKQALTLTAPVNHAYSKGTTIGDLYLRYSGIKFIDAGALTGTGGVRYYAPTTSDSRGKGLLGSLRPEMSISYEVPNTRLTLSNFAFLRVYAYDNAEREGTDYRIYIAPNAEYKLMDNLSATAWVDLFDLKHTRGDGRALKFSNSNVTSQVGVNWDVIKDVSLNPYINVFPGNLTANTSSLGMIISAKVL